jgi:hypothetical protein
MSPRNEPDVPDGRRLPPRARNEEVIARARVLISDPDYPTEAIVEELAVMLAEHVIFQDRKE